MNRADSGENWSVQGWPCPEDPAEDAAQGWQSGLGLEGAQTPPGTGAQTCTSFYCCLSLNHHVAPTLDQLPFQPAAHNSHLAEADRIALTKHRVQLKENLHRPHTGPWTIPPWGLGPLKQMALELNTFPGHQMPALNKHGSNLSRTPLEFRWQRYTKNARILFSGDW